MPLEQCLHLLGQRTANGPSSSPSSSWAVAQLSLCWNSSNQMNGKLGLSVKWQGSQAHRVPGDPTGAGVGPGDLQRSLPASAILGFCDALVSSPPFLMCMSKHPHFSQYNLYTSECFGNLAASIIQAKLDYICNTKCHTEIGFLVCLEMTGSSDKGSECSVTERNCAA